MLQSLSAPWPYDSETLREGRAQAEVLTEVQSAP
jgi:hypothetical protein